MYDALILDIMMPKIDGLTVLKTIRAKGNKNTSITINYNGYTITLANGTVLGE